MTEEQTAFQQEEKSTCKTSGPSEFGDDVDFGCKENVVRCMDCWKKENRKGHGEQIMSKVEQDEMLVDGEWQDWTLLE